MSATISSSLETPSSSQFKIVDHIRSTADQIMLYGSLFLLLSGLIGNFFNILIFTTLRTFHKKPCSFCLFIESIANFGQILIKLISYIVQKSFRIDASITTPIWCKLEAFSQQTLDLISFGAICIAAFDQFLATNPRFHLQQKSSLTMIQRLLTIYSIFALLHSVPFLIFFDIDAVLGCVVTNSTLATYYMFFYYPVLIGLLPIVLMSTFSLIAFYNVRHLIQHHVSVLRRRMLRQCTAMIVARVFVFVLLTLPYIIQRIYFLNGERVNSSSKLFSAVYIISVIVNLWFFLNYVISFYIFLLASARFRHQLKIILASPEFRQNQVAPTTSHAFTVSAYGSE